MILSQIFYDKLSIGHRSSGPRTRTDAGKFELSVQTVQLVPTPLPSAIDDAEMPHPFVLIACRGGARSLDRAWTGFGHQRY